MEKQGRRCSRTTVSHTKNRKRKWQPRAQESSTHCNGLQYASDSVSHSDFDTVFAVLVAAICHWHKQPQFLIPIIKKCIRKLHLFLKEDVPTNPIISLLPALLGSKYGGVASRGAEVVGAASLLSLEMNERIASDGDTVRALVSALANRKKRVSMAVCNAVLDLGTTSIGRERLLHFCALEPLIFGFFQVPKFSMISASQCTSESGSITSMNIESMGDELAVLLFKTAINLIISCNIEQLENIPRNLSESFLAFLRDLWEEVRGQMFVHNSNKCSLERLFNIGNFKAEDVAESIFRLSLNADYLLTPLPFEMVQRHIFGCNESNFQDFMLKHWEESPLLLQRFSGVLIEKDDIFSPFVQFLNPTMAFPSFLSSILQNMISCLPIASDELDILNFLKEARHKLGCPIIYEQDIRVLRTKGHLRREEHFFHFSSDSFSKYDSRIFNIDDVLKCEEAFKEGYTVALRGMEFHFRTIAAITYGLASLFGQPSVGANMYLTPPNSQGLACHYDDHCVFICQLFGTKQWKVVSQTNMQLPRLYDSLDCPQHSEVDSSVAGYELFSLTEGDILYIPRGCLHEAYTETGSESSGYSLHLTFGIEVELPFEWEGFVHVALCYWNETKKLPSYGSAIAYDMCVTLLHVAIGLIGDSDPTFRKACLVAAIVPNPNSNHWLDLNQKTVFCRLVDKINTQSRFSEALSNVEAAIQRKEDPFQRIRWIQTSNLRSETFGRHDWNLPSMGTENLFPLSAQEKCKVEDAFMQIKSRFCSEILFEDVKQSYKTLLEKYRKVRKQYMSGMLSLHYGS